MINDFDLEKEIKGIEYLIQNIKRRKENFEALKESFSRGDYSHNGALYETNDISGIIIGGFYYLRNSESFGRLLNKAGELNKERIHLDLKKLKNGGGEEYKERFVNFFGEFATFEGEILDLHKEYLESLKARVKE